MVSTAVLPDRWEQILRIVRQQGSVTVQGRVQALGVSQATVRRDLARIARRGLITRTWGGATLLQNVPYGPSTAESRNINPQGKQAIGREAARLVKEGDMVTPLESIMTLVTDSEADPAMLESFRMAGINVICAEPA